jgi:hypothetical protein
MTADAPPDRQPRLPPNGRVVPIDGLTPPPSYDEVWARHVDENWRRRGQSTEEEKREAVRRRRSLRRVW